MSNEELEKKIKAFNFDFLKFINPVTKELSNKVILFSSIIVFLNLKYLEISELEISGLKLIMEKNILIIILFFINAYYFFQFHNSIKIDILLAKIPNEFSEISETIILKMNEVTSEINNIATEYENSKNDENLEREMSKKLSEKKNILLNNKTITISEKWHNTTENIIKYHDLNMILHHFFPSLCYLISVLSYIILIIKY